jgi:cytidylate kinase
VTEAQAPAVTAADPGGGNGPGAARPRVVTVSASYGAGGSVIAPALAQRLGVPFVDRLLQHEVATSAGHASRIEQRAAEHLSDEEVGSVTGNRLLDYLSHAAAIGVLPVGPEAFDDDAALRAQAERPCTEALRGRGGVILGRAGAVVLADQAGVFHVRLDGPRERRKVRAARLEGVSEEEAGHRLSNTDRARELWVKRLYRADPTDAGWYHLVLDATVYSPEAAVEVVASAAEAFWRGWPQV